MSIGRATRCYTTSRLHHCTLSISTSSRLAINYLAAVLIIVGVTGFTNVQNHLFRDPCRPLCNRLERRNDDVFQISLVTNEELLSYEQPTETKQIEIDDSYQIIDGIRRKENEEEDITLPAISLKAISAAILLALLSTTDIPSTMISTYTTLLVEYPLPTKSLTSGALCGVSDIIAQFRDATRKEFNYGRLIRFSGKGCLGGIVWSFWYDNLDGFLDLDSEYNIYKLVGTLGGRADTLNYQWIRDHLAVVTTALSIFIEQFFWCPIVFGTFEIPVSTLLNGGSFSTVKQEVDSKLGGLLVSNAKVWTIANIFIYNSPVQWRPAISNCVDILWQSIVSDVAADCGKVSDDICEVPQAPDEKDYSFFAEKSRI